MNAVRTFLIVAATSLLLAACERRNESAVAPRKPDAPAVGGPVTTSPTTVAAGGDLDALIAKQGSVTFRSYGGKWIGLDGDTDLTFLPNGALHMFEYGYAVSGYRGTYQIDSAGRVTAQLPTFGHTWPAMSLRRDATSLLLVPEQSGTEFVMGNRGGATFVGGQPTYWPFRPLNTTEEARVRERIRE